MGNTIATGSPDLTLDDIHVMWREKKQRTVQAKDLFAVPPEVEERFRSVTHNIRAFRFCYPPIQSNPKRHASGVEPSLESLRGAAASARKRRRRGSSLSGKSLPRLSVEPLDLGNSKLRLHHTDTYLLINVCRAFPNDEAGGRGRGRKVPRESVSPIPHHLFEHCQNSTEQPAVAREDVAGAVETKIEAPCLDAWAWGMVDLFTPRGLASPVCNTLAGPAMPLVGGEGSARGHVGTSTPSFTYSLHVLKGTDARALGPCEAVLHALRLDEYFFSDAYVNQQLLQALFFNLGRELLRYNSLCGGSNHTDRIHDSKRLICNAKPRKIAAELIHWKPSLFSGLNLANNNRAMDLISTKEICERNTLLHALQIVRGSYSYDPTLRDRYLRGETMSSDVVACPFFPRIHTAGRGVKVHPVSSSSAPITPQGPSPLVIPCLTLDGLRDTHLGRAAKIASFANAPDERPGVSSYTGSVPQPMSPSLLEKKNDEQGGEDYYAGSPVMGGSLGSIRTPPAPRYIRPTRITTPIPLAERIRARRRSSLQFCDAKGEATEPTPAEPPIPLLSLKGNLASGTDSIGKTNNIGAMPPLFPTDTDDTQDRARRLFLAAREASEVLPWLFVGGEEPARNRSLLLTKGITAVVNTVAFAIPNEFTDVFQYLSLCTSDSPDEPISSLFPVVNRFIDEEHFKNDGKVFIHCQQGVSRSCSFVIAYIMWYYGMCYDRAHELVRRKRGICSPNAGFYVKLRLWERHLARPVFNRAYVYAPYTRGFPLPFAFHFALGCNPSLVSTTYTDEHNEVSLDLNDRSQIEEENKVLGGFAQILDRENTNAVLDKRLSYGFIFGQHDSSAEGKLSVSLDTFFLVGSECDRTVAEHARDEWPSFLRYNYYTSKESQSVNNRGELIHFFPMPSVSMNATDTFDNNSENTIAKEHQLKVPIVKDLSTLEDRLSKSLFSENKTPNRHQLSVQLRFERDCRWDALLNQPGLIFEFASSLGRSTRLQTASESRKRTREEELRQSYNSGTGFSTNVFVAERNFGYANHSESGERGPFCPLSQYTPNSSISGGSKVPTDQVAPLALHASVAKDPAGEEGVHPQEFDISFVRYPFDVPPIFTDLPMLEELQDDACWAIAVTGNSMTRPNALYIWLGCNCGYSSGDVIKLFKTHLVGNPKEDPSEVLKHDELDEERYTIRIGDYVMEDAVVQLVHQGEEPDELVLFL